MTRCTPGALPDIESERVDLAEPRLGVLRPNWSQLAQATIHVRLHIRYWRAQSPLMLSELGVTEAPEEFVRLLRVGSKTLIDPGLLRQLHTLEERARQSGVRHGFKSPWGGFLVLRARYLEWRGEIEAIRQQFSDVTEVIIATRDEWAEVIESVYRSASEVLLTTQTVWADTLPSSDSLRERFAFEWAPSVVEPPAVLADGTDVAALERRRDAALTALDAQSMAVERQIRQDAAERAAGQWEREVGSLITSVAARARSVIADLAQSVLTGTSRNGRLYPQQLAAVRALADQVRQFDLAGDPELRAIARSLDSLPEAGAPVDSAEVERVLADALAVARAGLTQLGCTHRSASQDDLVVPNVVESRRRLQRFMLEPDTDWGSPEPRARGVPCGIPL